MTQFRVEARYQREHGESPAVLTALEEVDALIDWLLAAPASHRLAQLHSIQRQRLPSGWPDHELLVGVDHGLGVGALEFYDHRGNLVTVGRAGSRAEVGYCIMGHLTEFPPHCEVSVDLIRKPVKEFCTSGGMLPTCVYWKVPKFW